MHTHRMNTKPSLTIVISILTAALLTGCSEDSKENKGQTTPQTAVECTANEQCADRQDGKTECNLKDYVCVMPGSNPHPTECGNGIIETGESCDDTNLNGKTCQDFSKFVDGKLKCSSSCGFDTSECVECTANDTSKCQQGQKCSSGQCLFEPDAEGGSGINCDAGFITVSKSELQGRCVMADSAEEIDESLIGNQDSYPCIPGRLSGKYCRKVTPEKPGSLIDVLSGQRCTQEQNAPGADTLRVHIIDVGQGDAIWIQTPDGKNVLIDGGEGGAVGKTSAGPIVTDYLSSHGFPYQSTFDAVILTHPHSDHFGGFNNIFKQNSAESYKLANYLDPLDSPPQVDAPVTYTQWITTMKSIVTDPAHIYMPANGKFSAGDSLPEEFFGSAVETKYITSQNTYSSDDANAASIMFKLTYAGVSFMFAGDAQAEQEANAIATNVPLDTNFFKVCHHGSSTSSTQAFLDAMYQNVDKFERYAVISSGRSSFTGGEHIPSSAVVDRLLAMIPSNHLFSTTAGDDDKKEFETYRDDNILIVVKPNGSYYACYSGTN